MKQVSANSSLMPVNFLYNKAKRTISAKISEEKILTAGSMFLLTKLPTMFIFLTLISTSLLETKSKQIYSVIKKRRGIILSEGGYR